MTAPIDAADFRTAMARFPGAVTIVTALSGTERRGITATAVCSVTADPPSLLVCLNRKTGTCAAVAESGRFAVNLLADAAHPIALRFAGVGGVTGEDKFAAGSWATDAAGLPLLAEAVTSFSCEVAETLQAGSHTIFIGQITGLVQNAGAALIYEQSRFHRLSPL
ncbi:MAG: nitrilotriacetate monooxygenase component B protein [Rhodobacteraceae bacterium]|uniref:flavin reductase family protein n=1 Tax=Cypionkella sp. TaxID=2811411 RepID=UPI00132276B1|nr:flavin reductase family protein [Cypionkella sp.]KAF0173250.1 MAG: nitrilotriacetate monooxygenase component B protein [Paracoccaceae bacterium]MDO8326846.1 flavin reductase family protein [Cypionkella sp.]